MTRSVPSNSGQSLVFEAVENFLSTSVCVSSDGPMMTGVRTGLPSTSKIDEVVLLPLEADGIRGKGPDLLAVDRDGDGDVPAGVEVAVGVGDVDLGLKGAGGRVEREARADDLAFAGGARDRLEADRGRILVMDEVGRQLGNADEDADRVGLLENEKRPAALCRRRAGDSRPG